MGPVEALVKNLNLGPTAGALIVDHSKHAAHIPLPDLYPNSWNKHPLISSSHAAYITHIGYTMVFQSDNWALLTSSHQTWVAYFGRCFHPNCKFLTDQRHLANMPAMVVTFSGLPIPNR